MGYRPLFGTVMMTIVFLANNGSQEGKPTNYQILNTQVDSLAVSVVSVISREGAKSVSLSTASRSIDSFVRQRLLENLLRDKFQVTSDSTVSPAIRIFVPLVEVTYSAPVASHIFGSSDVRRTVRSDYEVEISDGGRIDFAKSFSMAFSDTVSESEIPDLEAGSYVFLHGRIESRSVLDTILQPVLFVASAAVIVYLFFTLRGS